VKFNIQNVLVLPTGYMCAFFMVFSAMILTALCRTGGLVFETEKESVFSAALAGSLNIQVNYG